MNLCITAKSSVCIHSYPSQRQPWMAIKFISTIPGTQILKDFIKDVINNSIKPSIKEIEDILVANDVVVPPTPAERPEVDIEQIPVGARLQDAQVAYAIARDFANGITAMGP